MKKQHYHHRIFCAIAILTAVFVITPVRAQQPEGVFTPAAQNTTQERPKEIKATGGEDEIDISADNGLEWNETERVYTARGNAKAKRGDVLVQADTLKAYDRKKANGSSEVWKMVAEGHVKVISKNSTLTGQKATYDSDSKKAILTGDNLTLTTPTDQVWAKESLEYWENENIAIAKGQARARRQGRDVEADEFMAHIKGDAKGNQDVHLLEARGHVKIVSPNDVIFCDQAVYNIPANTAELTGNVLITQGQNQLRGEKVEANFATGKSKLLSAGKGRVRALIRASTGSKSPKTNKQPPSLFAK